MKLPDLLHAKAAMLTRYIRVNAPVIIGTEAKKHFRDSFQNEGFTDAVLQPWKEVKRRMPDALKKNKNGSVSKRQPRDQRRKILVDSGHMRDSIGYDINGNEIEVGTDDNVGKVTAHNEGTTTAGRSRSVVIPKRQFIGTSQVLNKKIESRFTADINNILK